MRAIIASGPMRFLPAHGWVFDREHRDGNRWNRKARRLPWRDPVSHQWMRMQRAMRLERERLEVQP